MPSVLFRKIWSYSSVIVVGFLLHKTCNTCSLFSPLYVLVDTISFIVMCRGNEVYELLIFMYYTIEWIIRGPGMAIRENFQSYMETCPVIQWLNQCIWWYFLQIFSPIYENGGSILRFSDLLCKLVLRLDNNYVTFMQIWGRIGAHSDLRCSLKDIQIFHLL